MKMSDEDAELRDLVSQTLENNGTLPKIRAELRASVFLALEQHDNVQEQQLLKNEPLKSFLSTTDGAIAACLIREFLEYFQLDYTLSVFDPETKHGNDYSYGGKNKLMKDLGIRNMNGKMGPVLAYVLQLAGYHVNQSHSTDSKDLDEGRSITNDLPDFPIEGESSQLDEIPSTKNAAANKIFNYQASVPETPIKTNSEQLSISKVNKSITEQPNNDGFNKTSDVLPHDKLIPNSNILCPKSSNDNLGATDPTTDNDNMLRQQSGTSYRDNLAPLGASKFTTRLMKEQVKDKMQHATTLKKEQELTDHYEDDFNSSVTESSRSLPESEIEEDISLGIDDLLSNTSGLEELTVDKSVSYVGGLMDFMESTS